MADYTKAPWLIERRKSIITAIGPCVADEYAGSAWLDISENDARLISAAPELLEALQDALCALEVCGRDYDFVTGKARAALAKVKGA